MTPSDLHFDRERVAALLETIERVAADTEVKLPISERHDELDAIAYAVNVLADELRWAHARVLESERAKADRRREEESAVLRDQLAHLARVAALDALSGSLAHEISQPLSAMSANAEAARLMIDSLPTPFADLRETLDEILSDSRRAAGVLLRVRSLLKKDRPQREPTHLRTVVTEVVQLVERDAAGRRITVQTTLDEAGTVMGDRVQIQQVVLNLLMNAFDALDGRPSADRRVQLQTGINNGVAVIDVTDTGAGLTDDELAHIFEPFYTTKPSGLGLGLAICRTIVAAHGGTMTAARNQGAGMTFSAAFPLAQPQQADQQQQTLVRRRVEPT